MQEPRDIAIAAVQKMLAAVGPDAEFPGDAIWEYATEDVESLRKPPIFKMLSTLGYIEDTGEKTNAVTRNRRSAPATKYRFGFLLRGGSPTDRAMAARVGKAFSAACKDVLRVDESACVRLCASLLSKRFLIATGLAGSGKTMLSHAFARWITPSESVADPFRPGAKLEAARKVYSVSKSDSLGVEFISDEGVKVLLPREIIEQWAQYIEQHGVPDTIGAQELRDKIKETGGAYSPYFQNLETHYKPAAFALLKARQVAAPGDFYEIIPVGADWTGTENVLGYANGLDNEGYVSKPALDLILRAVARPDLPHFLILDEMNLSHVERYFADILSAIESEEDIPLHSDTDRKANGRHVPSKLALPMNLFIIGTVNVDETTYMFSPKVLDRANVIEFRMDAGELESFLADPGKPDLSKLDGKGALFAKAFVDLAKSPAGLPQDVKDQYEREMLLFFNALRGHGAEFGYRVAHEAARFIHCYKLLGGHSNDNSEWFNGAFDCVVVQKFLPKLHGSRGRLAPLLKMLWFLCVNDAAIRGVDSLKSAEESARSTEKRAEPGTDVPTGAPYPLSAEKIGRMWRLLNENGFASFAEA